MMTTVATHSHQHKVPIGTALAVVGLVAAGGILGVAWETNHDSHTAQQEQVFPTIASGEYWKTANYHPIQYQPRIVEHGTASLGGVDGHVPPPPPTPPTLYGGHLVDGP